MYLHITCRLYLSITVVVIGLIACFSDRTMPCEKTSNSFCKTQFTHAKAYLNMYDSNINQYYYVLFLTAKINLMVD